MWYRLRGLILVGHSRVPKIRRPGENYWAPLDVGITGSFDMVKLGKKPMSTTSAGNLEDLRTCLSDSIVFLCGTMDYISCYWCLIPNKVYGFSSPSSYEPFFVWNRSRLRRQHIQGKHLQCLSVQCVHHSQ